jgi:hypothetical protein
MCLPLAKASIVLCQDPQGLLDGGIAKLGFLLPQTESHDETTSGSVVTKKTQLEALELPETAAPRAQTIEVLSVRDRHRVYL